MEIFNKMKGRTAAKVGLVGGILATVSVALTWMSISLSRYTASESASASGLDIILGSAIHALESPERFIMGVGIGLKEIILVVLIGGILALVGGIGMLLTRVRAIGFLLPIGGILVLAAGIWGLAVVIPKTIVFLEFLTEQIPGSSVSASAGYGIYVGIVGAILAVIGSLSLKGGD